MGFPFSFGRSESQNKKRTEIPTSILHPFCCIFSPTPFRRLRAQYATKMGSVEVEVEKQVALYVSRTCFADGRVADYYPDRRLRPVIQGILIPPGTAASSLAQKLRQPPTSVDDFITKMQGLFNAEFLQHFKEKCEAFDDLCGFLLSDAFIGHLSYLQWAELIGSNCFEACLRKVKGKNQMLKAKSTFTASQFDGSSDQPLPVTQIHLKGEDLKQAWATNSDTARISAFERLQLRDWTPSAMGGAEVFHGTTACDGMDQALASTPTRLARSGLSSQVFPAGDTVAIFTSFSVMRSFLWAAFKAAVIEDPPGPTPSGLLRTPFQLRGQTYHGVIVIKFHSSQPAPGGLTNYQIPVGQESAWNHLVKQCGSSIIMGREFWRNNARSIHGQSTGGFPDIVHGKDLPGLRNALGEFPCNKSLLWQTAWISMEAADALNARAAHVYAISFEREEAPQSQSKNGKKKGVSGFARKFGHGLKKMMSSKDLRKQ